MRVVASYGDFADRRLGVPNWVMLKDQEFRRDVGIDLETYDPAFLSQLPSRHSDVPYPRDRDPTDPADAVRAGTPVICVLVHPRHWRADRMVNARDDARRLIEGIRYGLRRGTWRQV